MNNMIKRYQCKFMSVMPHVKKYEDQLNALTNWWGKVALIGKINSHSLASIILDDMENTKESFSELHHKLIDNLLLEHLKKVIVDNTAKSQVTIDILIRNLFERTADVAFLATDEDIRQLLLKAEAKASESSNQNESTRIRIEERLSEYAKKYSVYDEIIILDPEGNVRANLDPMNDIRISHAELIKETLSSSDDYVETFYHCDLQPQKEKSLIYSCKITESNEPDAKVIGILCLCFRFDDEMKAIFEHLSDDSTSFLLLMDEKNNVIASNDTQFVPLDTYFPCKEEAQVIAYQGKEFLVSSSQSHGYQGFYGLGWGAMVMTPLNIAFDHIDDTSLPLEQHQNLHNSNLFSQVLKDIYQESKRVNDDLSLVVLNGQITALKQEAAEFMPVLESIKNIGESTENIFSGSVSDLQSTVLSSQMNNVMFMAALAVNIMDRNLYERANDCRWWALTSAFRQILSKPVIDNVDQNKLSETLHYINSLYTVYTNLYIFDLHENIVAVSDPEQSSLIGLSVAKNSGAADALKLDNSQQYSVSDFIKTPLYENKPTYIYNALISSEDTTEALGGIAIVFDSTPEFTAILNDTLPKNEHGEVSQGSFAMFVERTGQIISVTDNSPCQIGEELDLDNELLAVAQGHKISKIRSFKGVEYVLGVAASAGYREYKTTGDYENDILAFIFLPI